MDQYFPIRVPQSIVRGPATNLKIYKNFEIRRNIPNISGNFVRNLVILE
jgi:hypothetical protein